MKRTKFQAKSFLLAPALASFLVTAYAAESESLPLSRLMVEVINPAANTLWEAGSKQALSNQDWDNINRAVAALSATTGTVDRGGASASEQALARSPQWREWSRNFGATLERARRASDRKDQPAISAASKALVDVCQGCHMSVAMAPARP
jgi:hypothetical protein